METLNESAYARALAHELTLAGIPVHHKQLLTYLRLMDKRLGLLINFNVPLKEGRVQESGDKKLKTWRFIN